MTDSPKPFDFGFPAAPGDYWPSIMGDPESELEPGGVVSAGAGRSEIARPRYPSLDLWVPAGFWTGDWPSLSNQIGNAFAANTIYAWPFPTDGGGLLHQLGIHVIAAAPASTKARIGIYASTSVRNLYPGHRLFDSTEIAVDSTGEKTVSVLKSLPAQRVYWATISFNAAPGIFSTFSSAANPDTILGYSSLNAATPGEHLSTAFTYAALPGVYPIASTVETIGVRNSVVFLKFRE